MGSFLCGLYVCFSVRSSPLALPGADEGPQTLQLLTDGVHRPGFIDSFLFPKHERLSSIKEIYTLYQCGYFQFLFVCVFLLLLTVCWDDAF